MIARIAPLLAAVLLLTTGSGFAQTTQPANPWAQTVNSLASSLVKQDSTALASLLAADAVLQTFPGQTVKAARLLNRCRGSSLIGAHAYVHAPLVMAADIAADFKNSPLVPDSAKQPMAPETDDGMKRANATAAQWLTASVAAREGDPVGVIILWVPKDETSDATHHDASDMKPLFVLFKAQEKAAGEFRITQLVFGHPLEPNP